MEIIQLELNYSFNFIIVGIRKQGIKKQKEAIKHLGT